MAKINLNGDHVPLHELEALGKALSLALRKKNDCAPLNTVVMALRESKTYGVQFRRFNTAGLRATLSRWLRAGAFVSHGLIPGRGVMRLNDENREKAVSQPYTVSRR